MYFKKLIKKNDPLALILFHISLGILSVYSNLFFIFFFYFILFDFLPSIINFKNNTNQFVLFISYIASFEVFGRILNCSPWIPYEISKYFLFISFLCGLVNVRLKNYSGLFLLLFLIPGLFFDLSGKVSFQNLIFNILGPINLSLGVLLFSNIKFDIKYFEPLLKVLILPLLCILTYIVIKSPNFSEIEFKLSSNTDFTGGFGANQVSTIFGIGFFLSLLFFVNSWVLSRYLFLDLTILIFFIVFGFLSFSRGGVFGGLLAFIFFIFSSRYQFIYGVRFSKLRNKTYIIVLTFITLFFIGNVITNGSLLQRYQGKTSGILASGETVSLNKYSTGRSDLFMAEIDLFLVNPIGVGAGASAYLRSVKQGLSTHTELGRLLSEHGFLGLIYFLILLSILFSKLSFKRKNLFKSIQISFLVIALFTSFHAATRTYVVPLFFSIGVLRLYSTSVSISDTN